MPNRLDRDKEERLLAVGSALSRGPDAEQLAAFAGILLDRAAAEDLTEYDAAALVEVTRDAFAFFRRRTVASAVRVAESPIADSKGRSHTVVEVSTGNRPFIFDSVLGEIQASGHPVRLVVHPILDVIRDSAGNVLALAPSTGAAAKGRSRESFVHIHISPIRDPAEAAALADKLTALVQDVVRVTDDWQAMKARIRDAITDVQVEHHDFSEDVLDETVAFLDWMTAENFVFLGTRDFSYAGLDEAGLENAQGAGLGLLRDPNFKVFGRGGNLVTVTPAVRAFLTAPDPLIVTKANVKSHVHRRDYMDYIGVKRVDDGQVVGELRIIGLFTSEAFTRSVQEIPLIRRKVAGILRRAGLDPASHSGKELLSVLEHYPRTELFQASQDELFDSALAMLQLEERPRVRVLARRDRFDRFVSLLVFVPRDRYSSDLREAIGRMLAELYDGRVSAFFPDFSATHLTRVQFIIGRNAGTGPEPEQGEAESLIRDLLRSFEDDLGDALNHAFPPEQATALAKSYFGAFGPEYRAAFAADEALADIQVAEALGPQGVEARFAHPPRSPGNEVSLRFYHLDEPVPLSRRVPLLENLGFSVVDERTFCIQRADGRRLYLHDMTLSLAEGVAFDEAAAKRLRDAVLAIWAGKADSDGFNAMVLSAGVEWRHAALLRTVGRYLRQTSIPFSIDYVWSALRRNSGVARLLVDLFAARFAPHAEAVEDSVNQAIEAALDAVQSLDDDTILRAYRQVIAAALRTDFYAPDAAPGAITLKLDPGALAFVPPPRPFREIFVHSPEVDGLHMRFGPIARGGLRWSDRPQDFRTEILGLAKAQLVKNAVIVPTGAKGGFVPMRLPSGDRDAVFQAGRRAYIAFVDRLLAVTDDIEGEAIVPPAGIVRRDGDDPYLVVAADKGTATFSDTANGIALKRGFWLGDAFASGGSAGYDHKAMGITARGAWEAVKRHFRELDRDIQAQPFTVVGVGDMSGDVFGNAMLLSPAIKLVAAFDHRDIFVDPDPAPATSFAERKRLFDLPRSSWQDYDRSLLSPGGGIYSRSEKEIALSPAARTRLGVGAGDLRPADVLSAILRAPSDLLWFGGIGTYVRAPGETNADVGDKGNDAIRIVATDIGAKVVGEGANLGMTQAARIAYGLNGGRCNSDAIDNSAGVNTSDVEVNIKIALAPAVAAGRLSQEARLKLLGEMTDAVAALVLRNNYGQTLAISLEERRGVGNLAQQLRLMNELEERGLLDRSVENLASDAELEARAASGLGLTRAEIGTLLAFAKIALARDLVQSGVPDDPYLSRELMRYFPEPMRERFAADIQAHRLRREIIATQLSNSLINRGGPTLLAAARDRTGASAADLTHAYAAARDAFELRELHAELDGLDARMSGGLQLDLYRRIQDVLVDRMSWYTRNLDPAAGLAGTVSHDRDKLAELTLLLPELLPSPVRDARDADAERLAAGGIPAALAQRLALLPILARSSDIVRLADISGRRLRDAAAAFFAVADRFGFAGIQTMTMSVATSDYYENLALLKARDTLETAQRDLARAALAQAGDPANISGWAGISAGRIAATAEQVAKILADPRPTTAKATVAASLLSDLARG